MENGLTRWMGDPPPETREKLLHNAEVTLKRLLKVGSLEHLRKIEKGR